MFKHGEAGKRDGSKRPSAEYRAWCYMKARCKGYENKDRKYYSDRGIKVCDRWMHSEGFQFFLADMGRKPNPKFSLDRIDNDKGYSPKNCRWASPSQQARNCRPHQRRQRSVCKKNLHPLTGYNCLSGNRCRICHNDTTRRWYAKRNAP